MDAVSERRFDLRANGFSDAVRAAAAALSQGELVIAPTETVYGVFASARSTRALERLRTAMPPPTGDEPPFAWHAPSVADVAPLIELPTAVHRCLVRGLAPGPVRFLLEQNAATLHETLVKQQVGPGVFSRESNSDSDAGGDGGAWVAIRVPNHSVARALLETAAGPIVATRLGSTRWADPQHPDRGIGTPADFSGIVLDDGILRSGGPSTTVRVRLSGAFEVSPAGPISEETVMATLRRRILFVCTGNTCRSPMAEAIARALIAERKTEDGTEIIFGSAGVMAGPGMGATAEAVHAASGFGGDLSAHRSRGLSASMVDEAEAVFAMTASHADAARSLIRSRGGDPAKIRVLDPSGDIPDPIGGPQAVYRETAERIRGAILERFEELGL